MAQVSTRRGRRARSAPRRPRPAPPSEVRLAAGDRIADRYRLERCLGTGGSADVWLARDERLDREVAIKVLHSRWLPDEASRARFAAESRATAGLSHPAIVPVHDVIEDDAHPAIVLRYVEGPTLDDLIRREGPLTVKAAVEIGADLAGALAHAHRAGIVHLDLKPGNVLVDADRHVQLVDFGIARSVGAGPTPPGPDAMGPRQVIGTLRYMAPEQLAGAEVDSRSDLFAVGLLLHELLTGRPAYAATDPVAVAAAQRAGPAALPSGTPAAFAALIDELLALDPASRPDDAADVEARLRAVAATAADQPVAAAPGAIPTILPGLPAATAGLALANPAGLDPSRPRASREPVGPDRETVALPSPLTARLEPLAEAPARPAAIAAPRPARLPPARSRPFARPAALAAAGAALAGGIVLAIALAHPGGNGVAAVATASPGVEGSPAPFATIAPEPTQPPGGPHSKHHGGGKGNN